MFLSFLHQAAAQQIRKSQAQLLRSTSSAASSDSRLEAIRHELQLSSDLLLLAARIGRALISSSANSAVNNGMASGDKKTKAATITNCGIANLQPTLKTDIANRLLSLIEQYRVLWLSRYHPHGLQGSLAALSRLLNQLIPEGVH